MNKETAEKLAREFLNGTYPLENDEYYIYEEDTSEVNDYWLVHYESKKFLETNNPLYSIMIRLPVRVDKQTGECKKFNENKISGNISLKLARILITHVDNLEGKIPKSDTYHFRSPEQAYNWLTFSTNQDFGYDAEAWREWIHENSNSD